MKLENVDHFGILVNDVEKSVENLKKLFGIETVTILDWKIKKDLYKNPIDPYTLRMAFIPMKNGSVLELMQVLEGKSFYDEFAQVSGEGIHHICVNVEDIHEEIKNFEAMGVKAIDTGKVAGSPYAFLDTKKTCGFLIELVQTRTRSKK